MEIFEYIYLRIGFLVDEKFLLIIYDCIEKVEESLIVRYWDYLLENFYIKDEIGKVGGFLSIVFNYVLKVVNYFIFFYC